MTELFDIQADTELQKSWFKKTKVKHDVDFYNKHVLNPPQGYSTGKIDKIWEKTAIRREKRQNAETPKQKPPQATTTAEESEIQFNIDDEDKVRLSDSDEDFVPNDSPSKKTKYEYIQVLDDENIPKEMRNLRDSLRAVRPEVYTFLK